MSCVCDLSGHGGHPNAVMRSATGQIRGNDLTTIRISREVELPPGPVAWWLPQIADVSPDSGIVNEQVEGPIAR
jgi:hypothetical protein